MKKVSFWITFIAVICIFIEVLLLPSKAVTENGIYYIICNPQTVLNVRESPNKHDRMVGYFMCGDRVKIDGKERNGYYHCPDVKFEVNDGWIIKGHLVEDEPSIETVKATVVANGRVACRSKIGGERVRWLNPGAEVTVYVFSEKWCVTNKGYIQSEYLEVSTTMSR